MDDLISRKALLAEYDRVHIGPPGGARKLMEDAPTVDAVPVVRCKDCKHARINENHPNKPLICFMTKMCGTVRPEWYCADGERRMTNG